MDDQFAVDANLLVNFAIKTHPYHAQSLRIFQDAAQNGATLLAPPWLPLEAGNALRRMARTGALQQDLAEAAYPLIESAPFEFLWSPDYWPSVRQISDQLQHVRLTDATYIVLAQRHNCELWTADLKLFRNAQSLGLKLVRSIADY